MLQPTFYIIAGPNGAGKSSSGHLFIKPGLEIFNGDLVFAQLVKQYPQIEPERLVGGVAMALEKARDAALLQRKDFAFETNYSNDMASDIARLFLKEGYKTHLIYFGMKSTKNCSSRVDRRKNLKGHDVPLETIKYNYDEGIKRVKSDLPLYDHITFVDTSKKYRGEIVATYLKEKGKLRPLMANVDWYRQYFFQDVKNLALSHMRKVRLSRSTLKKGKGRGI